MKLSVSQTQRCARHILLDEVGATGRLRLLGTTVRVEGTDAAGQEAARDLVAGGVGAVVVEAELLAELLAEHGDDWAELNDGVTLRSGGVGAHATHLGRSSSRLERVQAALRVLVAVGVEGGP